MSYNKTTHALISRISPKINPTLKQGYSSVCTGTSDIVLPIGAAGAVVDVANSVFTGCTPFSYATVPATSYRIRVSAGEINKLVLDDGTILIPTPNGFKDVSGNDNHSTSTTMTMTHLSDSSVFYLEEYGFATDAVNNCYPMLANRSGYAGLDSGDVVKSFPRGLISRKGSIDIEAWNFLDTLIDFGNSTAVKATGLRISEMDGVDCNLELIYVAEPKLDPAEIAILAPSASAEVQLDTNFTVSGTSNCANVKIEASANGVDWTVLSASTTVTAGAFSKTDCQLSPATFTVNDVITIKVSDVDSVSAPDTVIVGTIATVTLTAIDSITATVAKTISGTTNGASVNIYYKLHADANWTLAGAGTVDTGTDTWTYSITIPTADTYDIKVTDGTDSDAYAQQDSIVVASSAVLTALQITNASDAATKGDIWTSDTELLNGNIIFAGVTNSSKIKIAGNSYLTGVGTGTTYKRVVASITKNHIVNWVKFFEWKAAEHYYPIINRPNAITILGGYIFLVDMPYSGGYNVGTVKKINPADGTNTTLALTTSANEAIGLFIGNWDGKIYVGGGPVSGGSPAMMWQVEADLSAQTRTSIGGVFYQLTSGFIGDDGVAYVQQRIGENSPFERLGKINLADMTVLSGSISDLPIFVGGCSAKSLTRLMFAQYQSGAGNRWNMHLLTNLSQVYYETYTAYNNSSYLGRVKFDGANFLAFNRHWDTGHHYDFVKIADSNTYSKVADLATITPSSATQATTFYNSVIPTSGIGWDASHYVVGASIQGIMESGFTQGDNTKYDAWIKLVAK